MKGQTMKLFELLNKGCNMRWAVCDTCGIDSDPVLTSDTAVGFIVDAYGRDEFNKLMDAPVSYYTIHNGNKLTEPLLCIYLETDALRDTSDTEEQWRCDHSHDYDDLKSDKSDKSGKSDSAADDEADNAAAALKECYDAVMDFWNAVDDVIDSLREE